MKLFVAALLALSVDAFVVPAAQMRAVSTPATASVAPIARVADFSMMAAKKVAKKPLKKKPVRRPGQALHCPARGPPPWPQSTALASIPMHRTIP